MPCRVQHALLGSYSIFNIYAPSGSDKKVERGLFFAREVFQAFSIGSSPWILGGDFDCVLRPMDIENGTGFNQKKCPALQAFRLYIAKCIVVHLVILISTLLYC